MAHTLKIPYESSQWSIDYRAACLERREKYRYDKLDVAVRSCLRALDDLPDVLGQSSERFAIRVALDDAVILRNLNRKYAALNS